MKFSSIILIVLVLVFLALAITMINKTYNLQDVDDNQLLNEELKNKYSISDEQFNSYKKDFETIDKSGDDMLQRSEIISYRDGVKLDEVNAHYERNGYGDGNLMSLDKFIKERGNMENWSVIPKSRCKGKQAKKRCKAPWL